MPHPSAVPARSRRPPDRPPPCGASSPSFFSSSRAPVGAWTRTVADPLIGISTTGDGFSPSPVSLFPPQQQLKGRGDSDRPGKMVSYGGGRMISQPPNRDARERFSRGEPAAAEERWIEDHLRSGCSLCQREVDALLVRLLQAAGPGEPVPSP